MEMVSPSIAGGNLELPERNEFEDMSQLQDEAIRAVSVALADSSGDPLAAIEIAQEQWQQELDAANAVARKLLGSVLGERESLRTSLGTAADLWRILRPGGVRKGGKQAPLDVKREHSDAWELRNTGILANEDQITDVRALQNVSHSIFYLEFIMAAPEALETAQTALSKLLDDKMDLVTPGNAAALVESHAILTAVERLRDLILLGWESSDKSEEIPMLPWFDDAAHARLLLEDVVLRNVFSNVVPFSQKNPRLLVAAARIVESEEEEDGWWKTHLLRGGKSELGGIVRPFGAHEYRKRALEAVVASLQALFLQKEKDLGLHSALEDETTIAGVPQRSLTSPMEVVNILDWIEHRRSENDTVRRFVAPCLPPSFAIVALYERELHRQFMRLITVILHLVNPDGSMLLSEADLILLTSWYCKYREQVGDQNEAIDSFLSDGDRERLISALQKHCASRIAAKITSAIAADKERSRSAFEMGVCHNETVSSTAEQAEMALRRSDLPDAVLGCINEHVRRMLALKIQGMDQAIAETSADCLMSFQREVLRAMAAEERESSEERFRLYACATANNMARCLEYSEDLRDLFIPLASDKDRSDIEERMEGVIEGFRGAASSALKVLIIGMDSRLRVHASRLYAPCTGTEIMLDIVATLEDYFSDYEAYLLPYHFEHLVIESLRRVVVWYLVPFLRLGQNRMEESSARRFTSLPTFGEMSSMAADMPPEDCDASLFTGFSEKAAPHKLEPNALHSLEGAAVIAQIEKDKANLEEFMSRKAVLYQKKQLQPTLEPLQAIRSLYTCPSTTFGLSDAFRDAKTVISRALRPSWVSECGVSGHVSVRVAEMIWESRQDVNPVVLLEALNVIRSLGDKLDPLSAKEGRMISFDDGRFLGSRNSDLGGPFSERMLGNEGSYNDQTASSSSLLWAPSTSRSSRSRK